MTFHEQIITIVILSVVTVLTRALPFIVFPSRKPTPRYIQYLGKVLPLAVFGMLLVYCIKDVDWLTGLHGIPELLGIAVSLAVHVWRRQLFLSIALGTIAYMIFIRVLPLSL